MRASRRTGAAARHTERSEKTGAELVASQTRKTASSCAPPLVRRGGFARLRPSSGISRWAMGRRIMPGSGDRIVTTCPTSNKCTPISRWRGGVKRGVLQAAASLELRRFRWSDLSSSPHMLYRNFLAMGRRSCGRHPIDAGVLMGLRQEPAGLVGRDLHEPPAIFVPAVPCCAGIGRQEWSGSDVWKYG